MLHREALLVTLRSTNNHVEGRGEIVPAESQHAQKCIMSPSTDRMRLFGGSVSAMLRTLAVFG
jgi:hypothetical protein